MTDSHSEFESAPDAFAVKPGDARRQQGIGTKQCAGSGGVSAAIQAARMYPVDAIRSD